MARSALTTDWGSRTWRAGRMALAITTLAAMSGLAQHSASAAFPGRNGRIVFEASRGVQPLPSLYDDLDIYTVGPGGFALQQITDGPYYDRNPTWSPDGQWIAFDRSLAPLAEADIYIVPATGGSPVNLTNSPQYVDEEPTWSPDGRRIAFHRAAAGSSAGLYVMDADGSNVVRIATGPLLPSDPEWSPHGRWIAVVDQENAIYLISPDGTRQRRVAQVEDPLSIERPHWSPDGKQIAFTTNNADEPGPQPDTYDHDMWIVNVDGSDLHELVPKRPQFDHYPAWSPEGDWIIFSGHRGGVNGLYKMRPGGGRAEAIIDLNLNSPFASPDWGPRPG